MAIQTDAKDERAFIDEISFLFEEMIGNGQFFNLDFADSDSAALAELAAEKNLNEIFGNDWGFQLQEWLPQIVDICCKYRGYKNGVQEKRVLFSGNPGAGGLTPVASTQANNRVENDGSSAGPESEDDAAASHP